MRLIEFEKNSIVKHFASFFPYAKIYLFESRVDDTKKSGDIDLYKIYSTLKTYINRNLI